MTRTTALAPSPDPGPPHPPSPTRRRSSIGAPPARRLHVIDRALDYVALAEGGLSAAAIARRRRRSRGYVSIVLRLGHALRGLPAEEITAFRSDRVTWKLAQRIVRKEADTAAIRRHLRAALGGFSTHNVDRRRHRKGRAAMAAKAKAATAEPGVFTWRWDAAWAERDPIGYVAAYRTHLSLLHRGIGARLRQAIGTRSAPASIPLAGQSLRHLSALLRQQQYAGTVEPARPDDREALRGWAELEAVLGDLEATS